jgi:hypothetical protein
MGIVYLLYVSTDGSSIPIGRASHARQVKGNDQYKKGYPGPVVGVGHVADNPTPPHKKYVLLRSF